MPNQDGYAVYLGLKILLIPFVVIVAAPLVAVVLLAGWSFWLFAELVAWINGRRFG